MKPRDFFPLGPWVFWTAFLGCLLLAVLGRWGVMVAVAVWLPAVVLGLTLEISLGVRNGAAAGPLVAKALVSAGSLVPFVVLLERRWG